MFLQMSRFFLVVSLATAALASSAAKSQTSSPTIRFWRQIAPLCAGYPSKADCNDGDMALFSGLLCASGEEHACEMVRNAQGPDGRWWRSPRRVGTNLGEQHSFSRDMSLGVMLYLVTTRDVNAARNWVNWIEGNRACVLEDPFGDGCLVRGAYRFCRDDAAAGSCTLTPGTWALLGRVFDYLGLPRNNSMRLANGLDTAAMLLEAANSPLGFELHLVSVEVFLKEILGATPDDRAHAIESLLARQPDNPFFKYLGREDDSWWPEALALCPREGEVPISNLSQWSWERDTAEAAWNESMAWDCLFLANLSVPARGLDHRD